MLKTQLLSCVNLFFIKLRLENSYIFYQKKLLNYFTNQFFILFWFERYYISKASNTSQKSFLTIIFNNLIFSHKGLNFLFSQPVNGQRTWSNAQNPKKLNTSLIEYKVKQFREVLIGSVNLSNLKNIIFLNYFNWLWKLFWRKDWAFLYKKNKHFLIKLKYSKKKKLTLYKLLNYRIQRKRTKIKNPVDLKIFFNFIGLDDLIRLKK